MDRPAQKNRPARLLLRESLRSAIAAAFVATVYILPGTGCQELVHMGQLSDRESARAISSAAIEQQQADGSWKRIGETDGLGRWWIMKNAIQGGGKVRITKPGYLRRTMPENDFLQENNILLIPSEGAGLGEEPDRM